MFCDRFRDYDGAFVRFKRLVFHGNLGGCADCCIFRVCVSVIVNYLLSMKYVFVRKEDMDRRKEFIIFVILSAIGLVLNEAIIKISLDVVYENWVWLRNFAGPTLATAGAKIVATGVVMVYNFVTRKIFLEQKDTPEE